MDEPPADVRDHLAAGVTASAAGAAWARRLPLRIARLVARWGIVELAPIADGGHDGTGSWVAVATLADGDSAVLKFSLPHFEGRDEIDGLACWNGEPTVRLLAASPADDAMLLERCRPGHALSTRPEPEQDETIAALLRRLWRRPTVGGRFRPLTELVVHVESSRRRDVDGTGGASGEGETDARLERALGELHELAAPSIDDVLLATDLHAGNVLAAIREPWLVIDPKPFVGDPAFDVTQHLLNCPGRLRDDPRALVSRMARLAEVDDERVRRWLFARLVVEPDWRSIDGLLDVADALDPEAGARRATPARRVSSTARRGQRSRASRSHARTMKIALGCDGAGKPLMDVIEKWLRTRDDLEIANLSEPESGDEERYAAMSDRVARRVLSGEFERGILMCGTGLGVCISANKVPGIRAALVHDTYSAERAVLSNDAQIITLGARVVGPELAKAIVGTWLASRFDPASHSAANVAAIDALDARKESVRP